MRKMFQKLGFLLLLSFTVISCNTDEKSSSSDSKKNEYSINSNGKSIEIKYKDNQEKEDALSNLTYDYIETVYLKDQIDTRYQITGAAIKDDKINKTLRIEFETVNLGNMSDAELVSFMMFYSIEHKPDIDITLAKTEKLMHYCDGGKKDGSSITLDRPTGPGSAAKYAAKVAKFAQACLDGGGCMQICLAYVVIKPEVDYLKFNNASELNDYIKLIDLSENALQVSLEKKINK